jgi:hypothetical protein
MNRLLLLVLAALPVLAQPAAMQTSELLPAELKDGKWYVTNHAKQAVTAYVTHVGGGDLHFRNDLINCGPTLLENQPLAPGATAEVPLKPGFTQLDIPAIIYADGSVVGAARTAEGLDIVSLIFRWREEEARQLAHFQRVFRSGGLSALRAELRRPDPKDAVEYNGWVAAKGFVEARIDQQTFEQDLAARAAAAKILARRRAR